jgi:Na+-transporting NADH:ubiquinone oxidoreductase subunit C
MVVFILIVGSILTATLVAVDYYTTPMIEENARATLQKSVLAALGIEAGDEDLDAAYQRDVAVEEVEDTTFYLASDGSVAFAYDGAGLWGPIRGIIALNPDGQTLKGVTIIQQEETPGLGGRIAEAAYLAKFDDREFRPSLEVISPGKAGTPTGIDAITGATLTSVAFVDILNDHLERIVPVYEEAVQ